MLEEKQSEDILFTFWSEYIDGHSLERHEMLKRTSFLDRTRELISCDMDNEMVEQVFYQLLQSYFDDLIDHMNHDIS